MRWSMWPVSVAVHIALLTAALIVPLTADGDPPTPAPMRALTIPSIKTVPVPPEINLVVSPQHSARFLPNLIAPSVILPPHDEPVQPSAPSVVDVPLGSGSLDIGALGVGTATALPAPAPPSPDPPAQKILRIGPGVREPRRIAGAPPEYPAIARNARVQGTVILEAVINERGGIERVRVLRSVPLLDAAAITAVENWRYTPTLLNGVPVSVLMTITINFRLD